MSEGTVVNNHFFSRSSLNLINLRLYSHTTLVLECETGNSHRFTIRYDIEQVCGFAHLCWVLNEYRRLAEVLHLCSVSIIRARTTTHKFNRCYKLCFIGLVYNEREGITARVGWRIISTSTYKHFSVVVGCSTCRYVTRRVSHGNDGTTKVGALVIPTATIAISFLFRTDINLF